MGLALPRGGCGLGRAQGPTASCQGLCGAPLCPPKEGERQAPAPAVLAPRRPDPCAFSAVVITGWFPEAEGVLA